MRSCCPSIMLRRPVRFSSTPPPPHVGRRALNGGLPYRVTRNADGRLPRAELRHLRPIGSHYPVEGESRSLVIKWPRPSLSSVALAPCRPRWRTRIPTTSRTPRRRPAPAIAARDVGGALKSLIEAPSTEKLKSQGGGSFTVKAVLGGSPVPPPDYVLGDYRKFYVAFAKPFATCE